MEFEVTIPTPWDPIRPERLMLSLLPMAFHSEFSRQTSWKPRSVLHSNMAQGYLSHKKPLNFSTDVPWLSARWLVTLRVRRTHWFHGWGWFKTLNVHMNGGEKKFCNYKRFWCDSQRHHGFDLYIYVYIYIWLNKACSKGHHAHKSQEPESVSRIQTHPERHFCRKSWILEGQPGNPAYGCV